MRGTCFCAAETGSLTAGLKVRESCAQYQLATRHKGALSMQAHSRYVVYLCKHTVGVLYGFSLKEKNLFCFEMRSHSVA